MIKFKATPETAEVLRWYVELLEGPGILIPLGHPDQTKWDAQHDAFQAVVDDLKKRADAAEQGVELNAHGQPMDQETVDRRNRIFDELEEKK
jgi:hypothetical protein